MNSWIDIGYRFNNSITGFSSVKRWKNDKIYGKAVILLKIL
jgi:hypothetical protein